MARIINLASITKKVFLIVSIVIAVGVFGYVALKVYNNISQSIIERKIKEAGLNPNDYDLRGIAPWNIREFITNKEIEKASSDPNNYDFRK